MAPAGPWGLMMGVGPLVSARDIMAWAARSSNGNEGCAHSTTRVGQMRWFFLLLLVLGLVFGWTVAAMSLVLWLRRVLAIHAVQAGKREILNVHRWRRARVTSTKRPSC